MMSPEVLIYVQKLKLFMEKSETAREYFNISDKDDVFFDYVLELSQKNFEEHGEPELSLIQIEEIRQKISTSTENNDEITGIFISLGNMGYISLN